MQAHVRAGEEADQALDMLRQAGLSVLLYRVEEQAPVFMDFEEALTKIRG